MNIGPVQAFPVPLCDATGLETPGMVEVHEEGLILTSPDFGTVGLTWSALLDVIDNPQVQQRLEEAREDGA